MPKSYTMRGNPLVFQIKKIYGGGESESKWKVLCKK